MFKGLGEFAFKFKYLIVLFWVGLAVYMVLLAPTLSETGKLDTSDFLNGGSESGRAAELIAEYFPEASTDSSLTVVLYNASGLNESDNAFAALFSEWLLDKDEASGIETVTSVYTNPALASSLISPDNTTMLINIGINLTTSGASASGIQESIDSYIDSNNASSTLEIYVSGETGIMNDLMTTLIESIDITTIVTVVLVAVLLLFIYRSPVAIMVPLLTIGIAYLISRGVLGYMGEWGISLWSQLDVFIIVLIFGAGTDYCLFMVSRYKEELKRRDTRPEALRATVGSIGSVITASAFAVIIGLLGLTIAEFGMLHTMGLALATAVFVTLLAALTLNPALASIFGRFMFWPGKQADTTKAVAGKAHESKFWNRIANITTNHSWIISIVVILVLAVPYYPYFKMSTSFDMMTELSDDSNSVKGFQILSEHFDIGNMMPSTLILTGSSGSATSSGALKEIEEINTQLLQIDGVTSVLSVVSPYGTGEPMQTLTVVGQLSVLLEQLNAAMEGAASNPAALFGEETTQMFQLLGAYLGELGTAFPEVTSEPSYISAVTILNNMNTALATVDPENIDMAAMANLQMAFQQYITEFVQALMGLSDYFSAQGNPYFIPQSLLGLYPELGQLISTFISEDAEATRLIINLSDYPYSEAAIDTTEQISLVIHNETDSQYFDIEQSALGGVTSAMKDVRAVLESDFQRIMGVVIAGVFLVLCLLLRSIVAPFFILALVTLTYGATMGISSWLFTDIMGQGGVSFVVPIIVFVLMIALGADYNIFLMSRIREEAQDKPMKEAIQNAIKSTSSVIIACGLILGGTFAAMAVSPIQSMFQLGIAIAIGIFLEAFVVVTLLLPAVTNIFGRTSWWPFGHKKLGIKKD